MQMLAPASPAVVLAVPSRLPRISTRSARMAVSLDRTTLWPASTMKDSASMTVSAPEHAEVAVGSDALVFPVHASSNAASRTQLRFRFFIASRSSIHAESAWFHQRLDRERGRAGLLDTAPASIVRD